MGNKRVFSTILVALITVAATLLLVTTLANAGPADLPDGRELEKPLRDRLLGSDEPIDVQQQPEWEKTVNGASWTPGLVVSAETSDTIQVIDFLTALPTEEIVLVEEWNPERLRLVGYVAEPSGSTTIAGDGVLEWRVTEGTPKIFSLTKWFHVEPSTWQTTVLSETVSAGGPETERRPVRIEKEAPELWIDSQFDPSVYPGDIATFTLSYGNLGGYENDVTIRNDFDPLAPFAWSDPPPDEVGDGGFWVRWQVGDLSRDGTGAINVGVAITENVAPLTSIEIWDGIFNHLAQERDAVTTTFEVAAPPVVTWLKLLNEQEWHPDLTVRAETSQTIEVVDVVDSPEPFTLSEFWNPEHLKLQVYEVTSGDVLTAPGTLEWTLPTPPMGPVTLTKRFHVEPGYWEMALLEEYLGVGAVPDPLVRLVPIEHSFPRVTFPGGDWPWYAQEEISVHPEPPIAGQPTELCAEVVNHDPLHERAVSIEFAVANFGIGLPFTPVGRADVLVPPDGHAIGCTIWVPPTPDHWCIEARLLQDDDLYMISQRNVDVDEPLAPNVSHARAFPVSNPTSKSVTITLGLIQHLPGWGLELSQDVLPDMEPGATREVTLTVTPPSDMPEDGQPVVDVEAYVEGELIGGFRKIFRPPVILHPFPDPPYAEREITLHPYPVLIGEPSAVCVELRNPTPDPQEVVVQFSWANFGIGVPFTPINGPRVVHLPPFSVVNECIHWVPPVSGHVCLQVEMFMDGYAPQRSQRNIDVNEPLRPFVPDSITFPVRNPHNESMTITLGLVPHIDGWGIELSQDVLVDMQPQEVREVTLNVIPGSKLPPDGKLIVDVEAFAEDDLIGGFRKIFRPPVILHPFPDPPYAEREILIHPYPAQAGRPSEVCVELRNPSPYPQDVEVQFSWAEFGIGLPFTPINGPRAVHLPPFSKVRECIHWIPPLSGNVCLQVELSIEGYETQRSRRNLDVNEPLEPNSAHSRTFPVRNPLGEPVSITLGLVPHFPDWGLELSQDFLPDMKPNEVREVTLTVMPPDDLPWDGDPVVDVEAFANGKFIGGFRKIFRPPVPVHRPRDPIYAESEIFVDPYPVVPMVPTRLGVEVFNPTGTDQVVTATFSVAPFGIGLPFSTNHIAPNPIQIFVPAHGAARGHVMWTPPLWRGKFCVHVTLKTQGHKPLWSQRNIDVGEPLRPGQPHTLAFPVGAWPRTDPVSIHLGLVNHRDGWDARLSQRELINVQPDEPVTVTLTVTPPLEGPLGTGEPIVDVEAFVDGELIGGFRKMDTPPVPLHKPHERGYAESEIFVDPDPPSIGQATRVGAELQNSSKETFTVNVEFGWANFGIGIPFTSTNMAPKVRSVTLGPEMTATVDTAWTPVYTGSQCVRIRLNDSEGNYQRQESQRNVRVVERPPCDITQVFTFTVRNESPLPVTVDIGLITFDVPADWVVTTVPSDTLQLGANSKGVISVSVDIPCPTTLTDIKARREIAALQQAAGGVPTIDVEGYIDGDLVGGIEIQFPGFGEGAVVYLPVILKTGF
jgi:hypothetical protein